MEDLVVKSRPKNYATQKSVEVVQLIQTFGVERFSFQAIEANASLQGQFLPIVTYADGNCLYHAICNGIGCDSTPEVVCELRVRTVLEIGFHSAHYRDVLLQIRNKILAAPQNDVCETSVSLLSVILNISKYSSYSEIIELYALASVIQRKIQSVHPITEAPGHSMLNCVVEPRSSSKGEILTIMWTCNSDIQLDSTWRPNHFCLLVTNPGFSENDLVISSTNPFILCLKNSEASNKRMYYAREAATCRRKRRCNVDVDADTDEAVGSSMLGDFEDVMADQKQTGSHVSKNSVTFVDTTFTTTGAESDAGEEHQSEESNNSESNDAQSSPHSFAPANFCSDDASNNDDNFTWSFSSCLKAILRSSSSQAPFKPEKDAVYVVKTSAVANDGWQWTMIGGHNRFYTEDGKRLNGNAKCGFRLASKSLGSDAVVLEMQEKYYSQRAAPGFRKTVRLFRQVVPQIIVYDTCTVQYKWTVTPSNITNLPHGNANANLHVPFVRADSSAVSNAARLVKLGVQNKRIRSGVDGLRNVNQLKYIRKKVRRSEDSSSLHVDIVDDEWLKIETQLHREVRDMDKSTRFLRSRVCHEGNNAVIVFFDRQIQMLKCAIAEGL
ncbi:hypothetical protein BOX15_Mlig034316g1 [Macrostomum lignano]|uniref:Vertnin n=1 Tax=Macrostomum lignano TaxID=282301 RepID=A0A267DNL4_9PLAT|nr:hypothetical protein BOX15_Mlig034316g1 [Macrostomum lignano]